MSGDSLGRHNWASVTGIGLRRADYPRRTKTSLPSLRWLRGAAAGKHAQMPLVVG